MLDFTSWGTRPWTRSREVAVDVSLSDGIAWGTDVHCDASTAAEDGACQMESPLEVYVYDTVLLMFGQGISQRREGWRLGIEIIPDGAPDAYRARACKLRFTDAPDDSCSGRFFEPECATTGHIRISHFPRDSASGNTLAVDGMLELPDGGWIRVNQ